MYLPTISLCMIVRDEEEILERCLACIREIADEIVIVDTGSMDRTKEIAKAHTDRIFDYKWTDDFSAARNFSFSMASMEYILWLDADDVIPDEDRLQFIRLKETLDPGVDTVMMRYVTDIDEYGNPAFFYYRERLVKRSCGFAWKEPVHEHLDFGGNVLTSGISIVHQPKHTQKSVRNLAIYEERIARGEELSPRGLFYFARELMDHSRMREAIDKFSLFLEIGNGWVEDNISACFDLAKCYESQNRSDLALMSLLRSFMYDLPRAEACCRIGFILLNRQEYKSAAYWFDLATKCSGGNGWGFAQPDFSGYIPYMELAVCYDRMGDYEKAETLNNMAGKLKPGSPEVLYNQKYFTALKNSRKCADNA